MELSWTTFLLEIINFLVLVWLLKRFLYKPVMAVIARRQSNIEKTLTEAQKVHDEATSLSDQYSHRLADWEEERRQAREKLNQEIDEERKHQLESLKLTLDEEREKARVNVERQRADEIYKIEQTAMQQAAQFATKLLNRVVSPELEAQLIDLVIDELSQLPGDRIALLRNGVSKQIDEMVITSAFSMKNTQRQKLTQALEKVTAFKVPCVYKQDAGLVAGVRITIGSWIFRANLGDELKGFTEFSHE